MCLLLIIATVCFTVYIDSACIFRNGHFHIPLQCFSDLNILNINADMKVSEQCGIAGKIEHTRKILIEIFFSCT